MLKGEFLVGSITAIGGNLLYGGTKSNCLLMIGNFYKTTNQQGLGRRDDDTQQEVL